MSVQEPKAFPVANEEEGGEEPTAESTQGQPGQAEPPTRRSEDGRLTGPRPLPSPTGQAQSVAQK